MKNSLPSAPRTDEAQNPLDVALDCVHCGLCLPVCPTYRELGDEADSPRGRIYLMRAHAEGSQPLTPALLQPLDRCLVCRACETACPSGVRFGRLMETFRAQAWASPAGRRVRPGRLGRWLLGSVLPRPRRVRLLANLLAAAQRTSLIDWAERSGLLDRLGLASRAALAPEVPPASRRRMPPVRAPAHGRRRARVLLLRGCVVPELLPEVVEDTIAVLQRLGCEVVVPPEQTCCGALHFHLGWRERGLDLLERNLTAFAPDADAIVVNAAGCGSTLKEYGDLPDPNDPRAPEAARLAARVRDVSEFLDELGGEPPPHAVPRRLAYDAPCHLVHGQRIDAAPRRLLQAVPGIEWVELPDADRCCGSAGIYNLTHPDLAWRILEAKVESIAASGATAVATGNPGCMLQLRAGLRHAARSRPALRDVEVLHPVSVLARAYRVSSSSRPA